MRTVQTETARLLVACAMLLLLPMVVPAWETNPTDLSAVVQSGDFKGYHANLTTWLNQKAPAEASRITEASMTALLKDAAFASALAQRHFITKVGPDQLAAFAKADDAGRQFVTWLLKNTQALELCLEGATPLKIPFREDNSWSIPVKMLEIWKKIFEADPDSKEGLYLRLAIATALRPPGTGSPGSGQQKTPSDPVVRYKYYKVAHANKELFPSFEKLTVWELQYVVNSGASEVDLSWGREMVNTWNPEFRKGEKVVDTTSCVWRRNSPIPHTDYKTLLDGGGKCGPRSSWSVFICQAFGIPAIGVGQPAHACVAYKSLEGWKVAYGRSWVASKLEGMSGPEFVAGVEARERANSFWKVEHLRWLASALTSKEQIASLMDLAKRIAQVPAVLDIIPFDSKPSTTSELTSFESPANDGEAFGARVRGFFHPPQTGKYVFSIASDDMGYLFLSMDETPELKKLIASNNEWTDVKQFNKFPSQKSEPVQLEGGRRYYIEAVHRELDGGDNLSVACSGPGVSEGVIQGAMLLPYPSGAKGSIVREVWRELGRSAGEKINLDAAEKEGEMDADPGATAASKSKGTTTPPAKPEPPVQVAPGVIHVAGVDFFANGGITGWGGEPRVAVLDSYAGGRQLHFSQGMPSSWVGYKIEVPATGMYAFTAKVATVNSGQAFFVRSFGAMAPVKQATASAVWKNMVKELGPQFAVDNDPGTRWAVNFGVDKAWIELDLGQPTTISTVMIDERAYEKVSKFLLEYKVGNDWKTILEGTTIGATYAKDFPPVTAQNVRLSTLDCSGTTGGPTFWEISVGSVQDGHAWISLPWTAGLWQTTAPVDIRLVKGSQTIWIFAPYQRGVSFKWFELKPKDAKP